MTFKEAYYTVKVANEESRFLQCPPTKYKKYKYTLCDGQDIQRKAKHTSHVPWDTIKEFMSFASFAEVFTFLVSSLDVFTKVEVKLSNIICHYLLLGIWCCPILSVTEWNISILIGIVFEYVDNQLCNSCEGIITILGQLLL